MPSWPLAGELAAQFRHSGSPRCGAAFARTRVEDFLLFALVGFLAQIVDGALGMA